MVRYWAKGYPGQTCGSQQCLALTGTGGYDNGYLPRIGAELVRTLQNQSRQENDP